MGTIGGLMRNCPSTCYPLLPWHYPVLLFYSYYIYIYIYEEMGSSYTFFKLLDLSKSNGQKNTLINANILIKISLIIPHLLYFISISKPKKKKKCYIWLSTFLSVSLPHHCSTSMRDSDSTQKLKSFSFHHPIIPLSLSPLF